MCTLRTTQAWPRQALVAVCPNWRLASLKLRSLLHVANAQGPAPQALSLVSSVFILQMLAARGHHMASTAWGAITQVRLLPSFRGDIAAALCSVQLGGCWRGLICDVFKMNVWKSSCAVVVAGRRR
jgi:hypothetical protein